MREGSRRLFSALAAAKSAREFRPESAAVAEGRMPCSRARSRSQASLERRRSEVASWRWADASSAGMVRSLEGACSTRSLAMSVWAEEAEIDNALDGDLPGEDGLDGGAP